MVKFDKFPAKLKYEKFDRGGKLILEREVEVFGYIVCDAETPGVFGDYKEAFVLVSFREVDVIDVPVCFLPVDEFNERFAGYVVVKNEHSSNKNQD